MSLRDVCRAVTLDRPFVVSIPAVAATRQAAERLEAQIVSDVGKTLPTGDLDAISRRIDDALASGAPISRRDLRHAPWCIFLTQTPVGGNLTRLEQLLREIAACGRTRLFRTLAAAYFHFFDPNSTAIRLVAVFLVRHVEHLGLPWTRAHREAELFTPAVGVERVAAKALATGRVPDTVFQELGFSDLGLLAGFRKHAFFRGLELIAGGDNAEPLKRLDLVRDWAWTDGKPRYEEGRARVANALLLPFGGTTPDKHIRDKYLAVVLPVLGDPRTSPGRWIGCEKAEEIARRWLTEASLRQFFEVVDKVAAPERWIYRRAFWNSLHQRNYIQEAWVVFESNGAKEARRMFGKDISFGVFDSYGGVQPGHSALLLRIGSLIVVEWSHNGKCRIWDEDSGAEAPRLFQRNYNASDLRREITQHGSSGQGVFIHHGSLTYSWQKNIAAFLRERRNINLRPSDYEVRP
jgi:hypothetical protein